MSLNVIVIDLHCVSLLWFGLSHLGSMLLFGFYQMTVCVCVGPVGPAGGCNYIYIYIYIYIFFFFCVTIWFCDLWVGLGSRWLCERGTKVVGVVGSMSAALMSLVRSLVRCGLDLRPRLHFKFLHVFFFYYFFFFCFNAPFD